MDVHTVDVRFRLVYAGSRKKKAKAGSWTNTKKTKNFFLKSIDGRFEEMMSLSGVLYIFCRVKLGQFKI